MKNLAVIARLSLCVAAGSSVSGVATAAVQPRIPPALLAQEKALDSQVTRPFREKFRWARIGPYKEAVDDSLLPIFLLRELGARNPGPLCRTLAYDYGGLAAPEMQCTAKAKNLTARAVAPMRLGRHRYARFKLIAGNLFPFDGRYPVLLCWRGVVGRNGGAARISWYEPALGVRSMGYPDSVMNSGLRWNQNGFVDEARAGPGYSAPYRSTFGNTGPTMDVQWGVYDESHAMALWPVVCLPSLFKAAPGVASGDDSALLIGPVNWSNGSRRREILTFHQGQLSQIVIRQPEIDSMRHISDSPSKVYYSVNGEEKSAEFWPGVRQPYLHRGRRIKITFSPVKGGGTSFPRSISISRAGELRFFARYLCLQYCRGPTPAQPWSNFWPAAQRRLRKNNRGTRLNGGFYSRGELSLHLRGRALRERIRYNAQHAVYVGDWMRLAAALRVYRHLLRREKIPYVYYVYSIEALAGWASRFDSPAKIRILALQFLVPAFRPLPPRQIARQVAQCVDQYQYGFALAALRDLRRNPAANLRLRSWGARTSADILALILKIKSDPTAYRRYASGNQLFHWAHATKVNELLAQCLDGTTANPPRSNLLTKGLKSK